MIILGLGSNIGDRLNNLRKALSAIKNIPEIIVQQVSPVYLSDAMLPDNAPEDWDQPYLNAAIRCETTLEPFELLKRLKEIEWSIGRKPEIRHWGPRILDIDILAFDDRIIQTEALTIPHENLHLRPFALWPLADVAPFWRYPREGIFQQQTAAEMTLVWGSRFTGNAPFHTQQIQHRIDGPQLVGILNVTPNSFSDGGKFINVEDALTQALHLIESGAEIIDIGAQSTAPGAPFIGDKQEWQQLQPVLLLLNENRHKFLIPPKISIDTYHPFVAQEALNLSVDWINDVSGLSNPLMIELLKQTKNDCVIMHHVGIPASRDNFISYEQNILNVVSEWADKKINALEKAGIACQRIILDPGIGFGKVAEHSFNLIKHINQLKNKNVRLLVGHSRKSFLALFTHQPPDQRDTETLVASLHLANQKIDYIRIHDVESCARGLKISASLAESAI